MAASFVGLVRKRPLPSYINQSIPDVEAVAPTRTRRKTVAGKAIEDQVQLLPGYIFFRTDSDEQIPQLTCITNVLKLLEYDNLSWELTGGDREFAEFLFDNDLLQPPHVTFIDGKLHFEDGFLYGHDDAVLRVNRRKKTVEVQAGNRQIGILDQLCRGLILGLVASFKLL